MNLQKAKKIKQKAKNGFALVEMLIACAIISIITFSTMWAAQKSISLSKLALSQTQANYLLEEGVEAVKSIRDTDWSNISNLAIGTVYYLDFDTNNNIWSLSVTPNTVDNFTRTIVLEDVYRDGNDDIAESGTVDSGTLKVIVTVSWNHSGEAIDKTLSFYLADIFS